MPEKLKIGQKMKYSLLEQFQGTVNQDEIICLLSNDVLGYKIHYFKGIGYVECFGGSCCEDKPPAQYYVLPCLHYTGDRNNYAGPVYVKYIRLSKTQYDDISKKGDLYGDITKVDLLVTTSAKGDFKEMKFEVMPKTIQAGPLWSAHKEWHAEIKEHFERYKREIERSFARTLDEKTFCELRDKLIASGQWEYATTGSSAQAPSEQAAVAKYQKAVAEEPVVVEDIDNLIAEPKATNSPKVEKTVSMAEVMAQNVADDEETTEDGNEFTDDVESLLE